MTIIKWIYTGFKRTSGQLKSQNESDSEAISGSVHSKPPGEWPSVGPQPSKLAVVLFYISVAATILGSIISIRTLFYKDPDFHQPLGIGCGLIGIGIILIAITNCIHNREQRNIMNYLNGKIEEMGLDENSRGKRNLRLAAHLKNQEENQNLEV